MEMESITRGGGGGRPRRGGGGGPARGGANGFPKPFDQNCCGCPPIAGVIYSTGHC